MCAANSLCRLMHGRSLTCCQRAGVMPKVPGTLQGDRRGNARVENKSSSASESTRALTPLSQVARISGREYRSDSASLCRASPRRPQSVAAWCMAERVTIACGAGFAGDRIEPALEFARHGGIDAVVLECLAERTMIGGLLERAADPNSGYDKRLRRRLTPLLAPAKARGCRIVTNLGSANPLAAAQAVARLGRELDLRGLKVAAIIGDDIHDREPLVTWLGGRPGEGEDDWLGVHAYLGVHPIAEALADGADVVVTGRVADSALFAAAAVAFLKLDDLELAGAMTVGHLMECSGQLTGGNLADMQTPMLSGEDYANLGYPIAQVSRDGTADLFVLDAKPARLDVVGCTLQLLYEVHDPSAYLTPDVTLDFSDVQFEQVGVNRVRVSGAKGHGRPDQLKAVGFRQGRGYVADMEIAYAGHGCNDRARTAGDTLRYRLDALGITKSSIDYVGVDSVLGAATHASPCPPAETRMHISAVCESKELVQAVEDELYTLTLAGPAGGCCMRSESRPHLQVESGLIGRESVVPAIEWFVA